MKTLMKFLPHRKKEETMLLNVLYHRPHRERDWNDALDIVYKDLLTGEKFVETTIKPEYEIYFVPPEKQTVHYNQNAVPLDQTERHVCAYKDVTFYIADQAGSRYQQYLRDARESNNRAKFRNIHKYPHVFGSDMDLDNWTRVQWFLHNHHENEKPITKAFLDIEVDGVDYAGFPLDGVVPVNAVTVVNEQTNQCFTFLLRNDKNPQIAEFEANIDAFTEELHAAFDETYGELSYNFYMYDEEKELQMLIDMFQLIHQLKPDFMLIWNMAFDIPYLKGRIEKHFGMPFEEIACHPDFQVKEAYFYKDKRNHDVANKGDYFFCSSYTTWMDQMINYAGLRKGQGELRSNALNAVAKEELGDEKLDYSEDANIKTLPYVDYKKFVMYNIKDVLLQLGIERRTGDLNKIYQRTYTNATKYEKVFKQTVFLANRAYIEFFNQGLIIGNNTNIDYGVEESDEKPEKFDGALVADPELNEELGMPVFNRPSKYIYKSVADMDFTGMYPAVIRAFNVAPNTMFGKLVIEGDKEVAFVNAERALEHGAKIDDPAKVFVDNYLTGNVVNTAAKFFGLPTTSTLRERYAERFTRSTTTRRIHARAETPKNVTVEVD